MYDSVCNSQFPYPPIFLLSAVSALVEVLSFFGQYALINGPSGSKRCRALLRKRILLPSLPPLPGYCVQVSSLAKILEVRIDL